MTQHSPQHWGCREEINVPPACKREMPEVKPVKRGVHRWAGSPMVQEIKGTRKGALCSSKERRGLRRLRDGSS